MIHKQELLNHKWALQKWNGGSEKGGYDEYWKPIYPHLDGLFDDHVSVEFNRYGDGKMHVFVYQGLNAVSFPNVTEYESLVTLWLFAGGSLDNLHV